MDNLWITLFVFVDKLWISQKVFTLVDNLWISQKVFHNLSTGTCQWPQGFRRVIHLSTAPITTTTELNIYIVISTNIRNVDNSKNYQTISKDSG